MIPRCVSAETIYQKLFLQARGELRTQLKLALRTGRARRVPRSSTRPKQATDRWHGQHQRASAEADDRAVSGHCEKGLIIGKGGKSQVATLVERHSRFAMLAGSPMIGVLIGSPLFFPSVSVPFLRK